MKEMLSFFIMVTLLIIGAKIVWGASLTLKWQDNSNSEDGFKIERRLGVIAVFTEITQIGPSPNRNIVTYLDTGLTHNLNYCYRVRAFNAAGNSGYTNIACETAIEPVTLPNDPTVLIIERPAIIIIP